MTKEAVRQEVVNINKALRRLDTFGISFSMDRRELENIKFRIGFLKEHHLLPEETISRWEKMVEDIEERQACLEEEQASLGNNWW